MVNTRAGPGGTPVPCDGHEKPSSATPSPTPRPSALGSSALPRLARPDRRHRCSSIRRRTSRSSHTSSITRSATHQRGSRMSPSAPAGRPHRRRALQAARRRRPPRDHLLRMRAHRRRGRRRRADLPDVARLWTAHRWRREGHSTSSRVHSSWAGLTRFERFGARARRRVQVTRSVAGRRVQGGSKPRRGGPAR